MIPGLKADENGDVWDVDGNYVTNVNPFTYEFLSNGEFTFEFVDEPRLEQLCLSSQHLQLCFPYFLRHP